MSRANIVIFNNPYRCSWPNCASGQDTLDPNNEQEELGTEISQGGRDTQIDGKGLNTSYGQELAEAASLHMPSVYQPRGGSTMAYRDDSHTTPPDKQRWVNRGIAYAVIGVLLAFTFAGTIFSFVEITQPEPDVKGLTPTAALILGHGISHNNLGGFFTHPQSPIIVVETEELTQTVVTRSPFTISVTQTGTWSQIHSDRPATSISTTTSQSRTLSRHASTTTKSDTPHPSTDHWRRDLWTHSLDDLAPTRASKLHPREASATLEFNSPINDRILYTPAVSHAEKQFRLRNCCRFLFYSWIAIMSIWFIAMAGGSIYAGIKLKGHLEAFLDPTKFLTNFIKERIEDFVEPVVKPINDTLNAVKGVVDKIPGVSQVTKGIGKLSPG